MYKIVCPLLFALFCFNSSYAGPLHDAVIAQDFRGVQTLLERGLDPNEADENGETPLSLAAGNQTIYELLKIKGAQVKCLGCSTSAQKLMSCARCRAAEYCSPECQKTKWANHKLKCCGHDPLFVLQGEVGFSTSEKGLKVAEIITSIPTTCTVVSVYHQDTHTAVLAHVDDYSSVSDLYEKIHSILNQRFGLSLVSDKFSVRIMGDGKNQHSKKQKREIEELFRQLKNSQVLVDPIMSGKRSQIKMSVADGTISFLTGEQINLVLELVQLCEYGDFNHLQLDTEYPGYDGDEIPFFYFREATRSLSQLPVVPKVCKASSELSAERALENLIKLEGNKQIEVKTQYRRIPVLK